MRNLFAIGLVLVGVGGCAMGPPPAMLPPQPLAVYYDNPILVPSRDHRHVWETVVDVVAGDLKFKVAREEPVRLIGNTLTEGRLDTFPKVGSTIFEPWQEDSAGGYQRLESTLQSIRRRLEVRVMPAEGGYWIDVVALKELEDVARPLKATAGAATFRYDDSLTRVVNPVTEQEINAGWIPQGRDTALEQRIIGRLQERFGRKRGTGALIEE